MIELAPFGRTGHSSSRVIFGAAALGGMSQERTDALLPLLREYGVNHIDTAAGYGDSELRLRPWMAKHRREFFLATKTGERTGGAARAELEVSLERLGVDQIDLIQLHNLVEPDEWEVAHGAGGVVAAMAKARDEGLVRFIGVTGHGTRIAGRHLESLDRFPFDSVLLPFNYMMLANDAYRADAEALLDRCAAEGVAVQTIKSIARRRWTDDSAPHFSWYEPLEDKAAIARAVHFVLDRPGIFLNSTSDARRLPAVLQAAAAPLPVDLVGIAADAVAHDMRPLFDGAALERI
jgi:aryl-alcohol dehydrogenase-like predicted oxidoreductase